MKYHLAIRGFSEEVWRGNIVDPEIYLYCFPHDSEPTHTMSIVHTYNVTVTVLQQVGFVSKRWRLSEFYITL